MTSPAVVFVHAFPLDGRMWRPQLERIALSEPSRVALAPDLRGFGQNRAGALPETVEQHARDLVDLLDSRGLPRAVVVGLSMGGYVALGLHRIAPERVAGLLLADTNASADTAEARELRASRAERIRQEGVGFVPDEWIPLLVAAGCPPAVKLELRRLMLEQDHHGVAAAADMIGARPDATAQLGTIKVPTAVVCGEHDSLSTPAIMRELAAAIPGATLTIVPRAGHLTNLEAPEEFNAALLALLARVDGG
jgi:pimeloyl-ACP methyl ester carboxylesterase